jgi:hypothetical protein
MSRNLKTKQFFKKKSRKTKNISKHGSNFFLVGGKKKRNQAKVAEKYCWAITHAAASSQRPGFLISAGLPCKHKYIQPYAGVKQIPGD